MTVQNEQDTRLRMLNSFLSCPHRDTDALKDIHLDMQKKDPNFYAHLAAWYFKNGDIRDHKELFVGNLTVDSFLENRETGLALLRKTPLFLKRKILGYIKGKKVILREKTGKKIKNGRKQFDEIKTTEKTVGLFKNVPTSFRKEITAYLKWLESDDERFDALAIKNHSDLKCLYASLQIKPGKRAKDILFKKKYPKNSRLNAFKQISEAKTPYEAAKLIVTNKIPYNVAVGLVDSMTPSVLLALINAMSPQEVINNYASLEERGAMDNVDTKALINKKLETAKTAKGVIALKTKTAADTGRIKNTETLKKFDEISDKQIKRSGTIKIPTAVFVDKSGSLAKAIEIGKRVSALISGVTEAPLYVIAFDTLAREIIAEGKDLSHWEKAFRPIISDGGTSIGIALDYLIRKKYYVDQIVIVTDEDENENCSHPFHVLYPEYIKKMGVTPHIVIINVVGINTNLSTNLKTAKISFDKYSPPNGDYNALPGLITLLSRKSKLDLLYEIMETPLPIRKDFDMTGTSKKH